MATIQEQFPVGTFFATSWGYDQTNVEFYRVVGHTEKCVRLQEWTSRIVSEHGSSNLVEPGDKPAQETVWEPIPEDEQDPSRPWEYQRKTGETVDRHPFVHRASILGGTTTIRGHYAHLYTTPCYATASGWGH